MSEDKNKYWDEIEQQLNKVKEEREKEKKEFAEKRQRREYRPSGKKGKRSKEYAEDTMVLAAIAAVQELTGEKDGEEPKKAVRPPFAESIFDEPAWAEDSTEKAEHPSELKGEDIKEPLIKKPELAQQEMTDTGSMIMLGPAFPLDQFEQLAAAREAEENSRIHAPIVLGAPISIDESLLTPIEEKIKTASVKKSAKRREKAEEVKNPIGTQDTPRPAELKAKKKQAAAAVQQRKEQTTAAAQVVEPSVSAGQAVKQTTAAEKAVEPSVSARQAAEKKTAAAQVAEPSKRDVVSTQLDQRMDAITGTVKHMAGTVCAALKPQATKAPPGERYFGPLSYEKLTVQRKEILEEQYKIFCDRASIHMAKLSEKESRLAGRTAKMVDRVDAGVFRMSAGAEYLHLAANHRLRDFEQWAVKNKRLLFRGFTGTVVVAAAIAVILGQMSAYEYMYNGKVLGVVKNQDDVYRTIDVIGSKMGDAYGTQIEIDKENDISFKRVIARTHHLDSSDDILNSLSYMRDVKAKAYSIYVGGKQEVTVQSRAIAENLLNAIKNAYTPQDAAVTYDSVKFMEKVQIKPIETKLGEIQNELDAATYMMTGAVKKTIHDVVAGETFSGIAHSYGIKQSELSTMNPGINPEKLKIGQEIYLSKDCPVLTVQTEETVTYTEELPYEVIYEDTSTLYKGEKTVKSQGSNGQQTVVAKVIKENGMQVESQVIDAQVLSQPVSQVVLVGTKAAPKLVGTGTYKYPVRGYRLSSKFGSRWGRTHMGVDLACPSGTKITAADGGTVTFAGYKGSFGYLVILNHGGGRETYYAHCSKLVVSKGQKVYQGQHIANVGSTGRSTGPHVHFEVHINGVAKNPLNYL